ncbi:MAG TPA: DNA-3-methyladenine glycosylase [Phycisphaerae bacterium]
MRHLSAGDARLAGIIARVGPWKIPRIGEPFTALCRSIVHQQLGMKAAAVIYGRLAALCPRRQPTPTKILALSEGELRTIGLSRQKSAYLRNLAEHFADGSLRTATLRRMNDEEVIAAATQVKGVGRWTAEMLLIFSLGRLDVLPVGDFGLRSAVQKTYRMRGLPKPKRIAKLAKPWQPYRSVATWYLWRSLDTPNPA